MGLLSRVLKTPDDDSDEVQKKLQAEESGLFMASSPAGEEAADALPEPGADASAEATGEMAAGAEGEAQGVSPEEEGEPAEAADDTGSGEPAASESAEDSADDPADDPLAAFRSTVGQRRHAQAIQDDLVDVPAAELLAEARSILDALGGADQGSHLPGEAEEEAA